MIKKLIIRAFAYYLLVNALQPYNKNHVHNKEIKIILDKSNL